MSGGYLANWDGIRRLAEDLDGIADCFVRGGQVRAPDGGADVTPDLREHVDSCKMDLGPSPRAPWGFSYERNAPEPGDNPSPRPALDEFVESWEENRDEIAHEIQELAEQIRWVADQYEETDTAVESAFRLPPVDYPEGAFG